MKQKKGPKNSVLQNRPDPNKELQIEITETDKASCTTFIWKKTARRGKPFVKHSEPDQKTLGQLKKQTPQIKTEPGEKLKIVKDCHIQIDDSSYGDWLLTQGIQLQMSPPSATPIVISPKPAILPAMMNMYPVKTATLTETDTQNKVPLPEQSQMNINTEDLDKLAKTQQNTEEKEEKQLDQAGVSQEVQVQSLTEPNHLLQMQTLIDQGASVEESLERIQKLKDILHIMENKHKPYQPNPTAKKCEGYVKDNKTELDNDNIEQKEKEKEQVLNKENELIPDYMSALGTAFRTKQTIQ